jgi:hypothetical protein
MELGPPGYFKAQYCFARAFKVRGHSQAVARAWRFHLQIIHF